MPTVMYGSMFFRFRDQGWSEKVFLPSAGYDTALSALEALVNLRVGCLPNDCSIIHARVGFAGKPRESKVVDVTYPVVGTAGTAASPYVAASAFVNDPEIAVHCRLETATGKFANYYFRGIPDDQVEGRELTDTLIVAAPDTPISPVESWIDRMGNYLGAMRDASVYARRTAVGTPPDEDTYETEEWDRLIVRGLSNKGTGRPFGLKRGRANPGD